MTKDNSRWKPEPEQRQTSERTEPAVIAIRTDFMYSEPRVGEPADKPPRCFCYRAFVVDHGDFDIPYEHLRGPDSTLVRMIEAFGDDSDLEIVVRPRGSE